MQVLHSETSMEHSRLFLSVHIFTIVLVLSLDLDFVHDPGTVLPSLKIKLLIFSLMGSFGNHDADDILQGDEYIKSCRKLWKS